MGRKQRWYKICRDNVRSPADIKHYISIVISSCLHDEESPYSKTYADEHWSHNVYLPLKQGREELIIETLLFMYKLKLADLFFAGHPEW